MLKLTNKQHKHCTTNMNEWNELRSNNNSNKSVRPCGEEAFIDE